MLKGNSTTTQKAREMMQEKNNENMIQQPMQQTLFKKLINEKSICLMGQFSKFKVLIKHSAKNSYFPQLRL